MRLEISDSDNTFFEACLPCRGIAVRQISLSDWGDNWFLLELERAIEYKSQVHRQLLVRSRWQGREVGEPRPTSVFVLLIIDESALAKATVSSRDFDFVTWAMARSLRR
jgi:hypothetical protein